MVLAYMSKFQKTFFIEKIEVTGHDYDNSEICVGMIFLPRNDYSSQETCKTIVESELTKNDFSIFGWRTSSSKS